MKRPPYNTNHTSGQMKKEEVLCHDQELYQKRKQEDIIEARMHQALRAAEFKLFLQPKVHLKSGTVTGAEALVRWISDDGQTFFPNDFIPLFERNGFCVSLDHYMLKQACCLIQFWIKHDFRPVPISVNQSRQTFLQPDYFSRLQDLIKTWQIPDGFLILEITEGIALENEQELNALLTQIRTLGIQISMDDFGTGYSSLTVLGNLEIDELKLDRGFLLKASEPSNSRARIIMEYTLQMANRLQIPTVVEGIETWEQAELSQNLGSIYGQGYLYGKPMPVEEFHVKYAACKK